jgi:peptidoglycan hydrolase-like protein with peptidoglycan-binding domain
MRRISLAAAAVLVTASGLSGITLMSATPASAQASCTGTSFYTDVNGATVSIPTIGNGTHLDNCLLGVGNDSEAVAWLQGSLNACYGQHLTVDGSYGPLTKAAVEVAQRDAKITVDGIYGPQTRDHILWVEEIGNFCGRL